MKSKYYYILVVLFFVISCCKRDNSTPPNVFTSTSYPLAIGNWWEYQLTSLIFNPDTFIMRIDSMVTVGPYTKYVCNLTGSGGSGPIGYFLQSDTSMSFVNVPNSYFVAFPSFHLKFPVDLGQSWPGAFPGDSTLVVGVANGNCYTTTYGPCYYTNETYDVPHYLKIENMILTPKIGLVMQSIDFNSDTAGIQIQQRVNLINYHVQ
jgi:hypothetical protein